MKKIFILFLFMFIFIAVSFSASANTTGKAKVRPLKAKARSSSVEAKAEPVQDYKNEVNAALGNLKTQIDKVDADKKDVKVGGQVFFNYSKALQNSSAYLNRFDVDRAYLDFKKKLDGGAAVRVTLDVRRSPGSSTQNLFDYLKYAYVDLPVNVAGLQVIPFDLTAKVGLQQTVWIDWADKMLGLRWIAKSLVDNEGLMSSSDFGVGAAGKVSITGLPGIEYQVTALNGSGYATFETNAGKDLSLRLTSTLAVWGDRGKVILGAFETLKTATTGNLSGTTSLGGAMLGYKHELGTLCGEYVAGSGATGYSLGGVYGFRFPFSVFARLDNYDPSAAANNQIDRSFYGIIYEYSKDVKFSLDVQNVTGGSAASTSPGATTSTLYLHTLVNY